MTLLTSSAAWTAIGVLLAAVILLRFGEDLSRLWQRHLRRRWRANPSIDQQSHTRPDEVQPEEDT